MRRAFSLTSSNDITADDPGMTLLDYFAAHEPTAPPAAFWMQECPPNPLKARDGSPMPTSDPSPKELAAGMAKWRYLCADAMLKESQKRA